MINLNKYLGKWHEIAKIDNNFQYNMDNVTAEYIKDNNKIIVINSGYINGELKQIKGEAIISEYDDILKVSFYPGIYLDYKILAIDEDYQYALIGGQSKNLLWILSRTENIDRNTYNRFIEIAKKNGYNINKLIFNE